MTICNVERLMYLGVCRKAGGWANIVVRPTTNSESANLNLFGFQRSAKIQRNAKNSMQCKSECNGKPGSVTNQVLTEIILFVFVFVSVFTFVAGG